MQRGYEQKIKDSFILLKNNSTLFLPDLTFTLFALIIGTLFLYYNNLLNPILTIISGGSIEESIINIVKDISSSTPKIIFILISFLISLFITLTFGLSYSILKYYLILNYINNKKVDIIRSYYAVNKLFFLRLLLINLILFSFFLIPLIILSIIAYLLNINLLNIIFAIILFIFWLLIRFIFFFNIQILFIENKGVIETLKLAYKYTLDNKLHILLTFLITFAISWSISFLLNIIPSIMSQFTISTSILIVIFIVFGIIRYFINLAVNIWSSIFLFKNYKN